MNKKPVQVFAHFYITFKSANQVFFFNHVAALQSLSLFGFWLFNESPRATMKVQMKPKNSFFLFLGSLWKCLLPSKNKSPLQHKETRQAAIVTSFFFTPLDSSVNDEQRTLRQFRNKTENIEFHHFVSLSILIQIFFFHQGTSHGERANWRDWEPVGERGVQTLWAVPLHLPGEAHAVPPPMQSHGRTGRGRDPQLSSAGHQSQSHKWVQVSVYPLPSTSKSVVLNHILILSNEVARRYYTAQVIWKIPECSTGILVHQSRQDYYWRLLQLILNCFIV